MMLWSGNTTAQRSSLESVRTADLQGQLLPGIPNEITINKIAPKLSWMELPNLSSLSSDWKKAIQGHLLRDARVRTGSTEKFVVFLRDGFDLITISLYRMRDKSWFQLPPIPGLARGFPLCCECVSLDGKLYVLGGAPLTQTEGRGTIGLKTVYMLDLAGQRKWKKCANMRQPRQDFGAGVINGKLYAFGGYSECKAICEVEVYDPKVDSWSGVKPMVSNRVYHRVEAIGKELFVHSGEVHTAGEVKDAFSLEVYHDVNDEWRVIEGFSFGSRFQDVLEQGRSVPFPVEGIFHLMTSKGIYVHDMNASRWWQVGEYQQPEAIVPLKSLFLEDELLVIVDWTDDYGTRECLLQSREFRQHHHTQGIIFDLVRFMKTKSKRRYDLLCSIEL